MKDLTDLANFDTRSQVVVAKLLTLIQLVTEAQSADLKTKDVTKRALIFKKFLYEFKHRIHSAGLIASALHTDIAKALETEVRHAEAAAERAAKNAMDDKDFPF